MLSCSMRHGVYWATQGPYPVGPASGLLSRHAVRKKRLLRLTFDDRFDNTTPWLLVKLFGGQRR